MDQKPTSVESVTKKELTKTLFTVLFTRSECLRSHRSEKITIRGIDRRVGALVDLLAPGRRSLSGESHLHPCRYRGVSTRHGSKK